MLSSNRQSILQRPVKKTTKFNRENRDTEYEREQQMLQAKRNKYNALVDHRRRAMYGNSDEKKELQDARRKEIDEHLAIRRQLEEEEKKQDEGIVNYQSTQQESNVTREQAEKMKKKEYLRQIMEENKKLVEYRKQLQSKEKKQNQQAEQDETEFFDRYRSYR